MIVDTHVHVVSDDPTTYPLAPAGLPGAWYREAPHSAEQLLELMTEARVGRAVLVQGVGAYSFDNAYVADCAAAHPDRFAGVCCIDANGDDPVGTLTYWVEERGIDGVRLFALSREATSWLSEPRSFPIWQRAEKLGARVVVTVLQHQLAELRAALERFPDISVSLDHCGFPQLEEHGFEAARSLLELAALPNLFLKVSTNVLDEAEKAGGSEAFVALLAERFGADRLMWGSDFSQTHDRSYAELVRFGCNACARLSPPDRDLVLGGTALRIWPTLRPGISV